MSYRAPTRLGSDGWWTCWPKRDADSRCLHAPELWDLRDGKCPAQEDWNNDPRNLRYWLPPSKRGRRD